MNSDYIKLTMKACIRYLKYRSIPKAQGRRIIIAGNGPSLADNIENHIDILQRETIFSVNHFADSDAFSLIKPKCYCLMDPNFYLKHLSAERLECRNKTFLNLNKKTAWELHLFCPIFPGQIILENYFSSTDIHLHIFNPFGKITCRPARARNYLYRTNFFMPPPQNVLVAAIFMALNMGYKDIYLIGAEHSWLADICVNDKNTVCSVQTHFTGHSELKPLYKSAPKHAETFKYHEWLGALTKTFRSYWLLREYAAFRGATIYNATPNSYIDAFERKSITSLSS